MIADISKTSGLRTIFTRATEVRFMDSVRSGATNHVLAEIQAFLAEFRLKAAEFGAKKIAVFGTDAMRHLASFPEFTKSPVMAGIQVLDHHAEALCSLIGAVKGLGLDSEAGMVLVIDQGGGRIELALGEVTSSVEMIGFASAELGGDVLLQRFRECKLNLSKFHEWLKPRIYEITLPAVQADRVIAQGGVATKCAWLAVRRDQRARYKPSRVHGTLMNIRSLQKMAAYVEGVPTAKWGALRANVDPQDQLSDAFERLVTGSVALHLLLQRLNLTKFTVNAFGTRHGMAWQIATELAEVPAGLLSKC